jgi:peptidoglycan/LPS O-acetylase OafA/YrhL
MMAHTGYDAIAIGVLLGEFMVRSRSRSLLMFLATKVWLFWLCLFILFVFSPVMVHLLRGSYAVTFGATIDLIAISGIIIVAVTQHHRVLFRILNWRPIMFVGTLSYSIYIWNPLFLYEASPIPFNQAPINFVLVIVAALISYYGVERPFLRLKERLGKRSLLPLSNPTH